MELLICIAAATVAFVMGALWYAMLKPPALRGIAAPVDNRGYPFDKSPLPYLATGTCLLAMAVLLRAMFLHYGIHGMIEGFGIGVGIGGLVGLPLAVIHGLPVHRDLRLVLVDGGHAIIVGAVLGAILGAL